MEEIEKKFIIKKLPSGLTNPIRYERYFIYNNNGIQVRVQRKGNKYELERKIKKEENISIKEKTEISEEEFLQFKKYSIGNGIIRNSYIIDENATIKEYLDNYEGLIRVEIEFKSLKELKNFIIPNGYIEITDSILGNDNQLMNLDREEFEKELNKIFS